MSCTRINISLSLNPSQIAALVAHDKAARLREEDQVQVRMDPLDDVIAEIVEKLDTLDMLPLTQTQIDERAADWAAEQDIDRRTNEAHRIWETRNI